MTRSPSHELSRSSASQSSKEALLSLPPYLWDLFESSIDTLRLRWHLTVPSSPPPGFKVVSARGKRKLVCELWREACEVDAKHPAGWRRVLGNRATRTEDAFTFRLLRFYRNGPLTLEVHFSLPRYRYGNNVRPSPGTALVDALGDLDVLFQEWGLQDISGQRLAARQGRLAEVHLCRNLPLPRPATEYVPLLHGLRPPYMKARRSFATGVMFSSKEQTWMFYDKNVEAALRLEQGRKQNYSPRGVRELRLVLPDAVAQDGQGRAEQGRAAPRPFAGCLRFEWRVRGEEAVREQLLIGRVDELVKNQAQVAVWIDNQLNKKIFAARVQARMRQQEAAAQRKRKASGQSEARAAALRAGLEEAWAKTQDAQGRRASHPSKAATSAPAPDSLDALRDRWGYWQGVVTGTGSPLDGLLLEAAGRARSELGETAWEALLKASFSDKSKRTRDLRKIANLHLRQRRVPASDEGEAVSNRVLFRELETAAFLISSTSPMPTKPPVQRSL